MTEIGRRASLVALGAGLATIAGCAELLGSGDEPPDDAGELPRYATALPARDGGEYFYGAVDVGTMRALTADDEAEAGDVEPVDPLIRNPVVAALQAIESLSLLGGSPAAPAYADGNRTPDGEEYLVFGGGAATFVGSYDVETILDGLDEAGFAAVDRDETFAIVEDGETGQVVGVEPELFAFGYPGGDEATVDPVETVERTVDGSPRQHEADDAFRDLLEAGPAEPGVSVGYYAADGLEVDDRVDGAPEEGSDETLEYAFGPFDGARGVHQHLSLREDGGADARAVVSYASPDVVDLDRLEDGLGDQAAEFELSADDAVASVDATYAADVVEGE